MTVNLSLRGPLGRASPALFTLAAGLAGFSSYFSMYAFRKPFSAATLIAPIPWMILAGTGLYIAYNPINAVLFDRLVAASGRVATAGFLIYVADSSGYLGSVLLLLWRNFGQASLNWLQFIIWGAYATSLAGAMATCVAALYFHRRLQPSRQAPSPLAGFENEGANA